MKRCPLLSLSFLTAAAAVLFAALTSPACADAAAPALLGVSAPTMAEVHALGDWYRLHIPPRFRARQAVSVSLLTDGDMGVYLASQGDSGDGGGSNDNSDDGDIDGVFENNPPTITLRLPDTGVADTLTFAHEYGHYVWFDMLSAADRRRYQTIYDRQKSAHRLITDYASTCVQEGFAEAFSYFIARPAALDRRDPLSYQFLAAWPGER